MGEGARAEDGDSARGFRTGDGACAYWGGVACCIMNGRGVNRGDGGLGVCAYGEAPRVGEKCNGENDEDANGLGG